MTEATRLDPTHVVELHPMYLLRWEEAEQAHVLLYPEGIVKLNSSAAEILKRVAGGRRINDVVAELSPAKEIGQNNPRPLCASHTQLARP